MHATSLPDLLERLGRRYLSQARRRGVQLALDIDPALATDLVGPFRALAELLQQLIALAIENPHGHRVTLFVDVVHDEPGRQTAHFSVDLAAPPAAATDAFGISDLRRKAQAVGGTLHEELGDACHLSLELGFIVPPAPPHVDVVALRATLGSDEALHEVIDALGNALAADVGHLERALAQADAAAVRQWLHRVSGALGMAEATGLAAMGLRLEQDMVIRSVDDMALAVRRFAVDATRALAWLREGRLHDPLI
ncbi:Hpt domain-containing protein [Luteibacter aegosomaticola]|uniref:Hpt domain-containing protein n=1 Tax=Luteibacter aegosomaticola TaxID=2911538 RepID=UPI001FF8DE9F|nr:Hpt domain-containing protein [Luteibacter aegosomaticola]UPG92236.1 Hpt domain-containing protein [Luteibacter aegosomaticola]